MPRLDITTRRYGHLIAVRPTGKTRGSSQSAEWECLCDCGATHVTTVNTLRGSNTIRCRACRARNLSIVNTKHGMARNNSPEYTAWQNMLRRCLSPNHPNYASYGGRGITVCEAWQQQDGFKNFFKDVGPRPSSNMSLSRIDNDQGYYPDNVKWDTKRNQQLNRRSTRYLTVNKVTKPLLEWSEISSFILTFSFQRYFTITLCL